MGTTRNLQTITIIGEDNGQSSNAPTRSPTVAVPRPTTIRVCAQAPADAVVVTAEVTYRYEVEIAPDSGELTDLTWSTNIPSWVDGATVDILAGHLCVGSDEVAVEADNFDRLLSNLAPCVLSISSGSQDVFLDEACTATDTVCGLYSGTVRVTYTDVCAKSEVVDAVLFFVTAGTGEVELLQIANQIAQRDDISLTSVTFSEYPVVENPAPTEEPALSSELDGATPKNTLNEGLTQAGIAMISLLGVILIFLLALLFVRCRQARKLQGGKDDDARSLKTAGSSPCLDRDGNRPDMLSVDLCTPLKLKPLDDALRNEAKNCDNEDCSNDSDTQVRKGGTARVLFGDADMNLVNEASDADSVHTDSFKEILNDVTFVRKEEPESAGGSKPVDRPKLGCSLPNSTNSVAL